MFRTFPFVAFRPDEPVSGDPAPVTPPAPAPAAPAVPEVQPGPWAADLAQYIEDPAARAQADRYLREKVQPRMTQFEQDAARYEGAHRLYDDLVDDADSTMVAIAEQVYGPEVAQSIAQALAAEEAAAAPTAPATPAAPQLGEDERAALAWATEQRQQHEWNTTVAPLKAADPEFDEQDFAPFILTADGDVDAAYQGYKAWRERATAKFRPAEPVTEETAPAPVLGTGAADASAPTPAVAKRHTSIDSALDEWLSEQRTAAPPAVGTV
jgi:hypothetical protein